MRSSQSAKPNGPPAWRLEPGTKWLYNIDGILWPVVLLDEEFVDESEQQRISVELQPALQLGHHNLIWVETAHLFDFDPSTGISNASNVGLDENDVVSLAFSEAISKREMQYWHGLLVSERYARQFANGGASPVRTPDARKEEDVEVIDLAQESDEEDGSESEERIEPFTSNPKFATILIGRSREPIIIPMEYVMANRHMSECISMRDSPNTGEVAIVVSRRAFENHRPSTFRLIAVWMRLGQYQPRFDDHGRFQPVIRGEMRRQEMVRVGQVFDLAREMLIFEIFQYLWQRYEALKPWPPESLLQLITIVLRRPRAADVYEDLLRGDLADSVARSYSEIVEDDGGNVLHALFERHADFAYAVFKRRYKEWVKDNPDEVVHPDELDDGKELNLE